MDRGTFTKTAIAGVLVSSPAFAVEPPSQTHVVMLSLDDGFQKSCYKIADIGADEL